MNLYSLEKPSCNYRYSDISLPKGSLTQMIANPPPKKSDNTEHFLCILIPFRDRFEELLEFVPRITKFLERQNVEHKIFIINQVIISNIWIYVLDFYVILICNHLRINCQ